MVRYRGPKNRIARRFGVNIFGRRRNPLIHKPAPPGMHGAKRKKKSDYGLQMEEKQKLKTIYGMITHRQLVNYYKKALKKVGNTSTNLIQLLECRLDNIVYRLNLAPTIFAAQQLISHGHVLVNDKKVDIRSFEVKPKMAITIKEKSKKIKIIKESQATTKELPSYLSLSSDKNIGTLEILPEQDQIPFPIIVSIPLVCEFLAHTS